MFILFKITVCVIWGYIVFLSSLETVDLWVRRLETNSGGVIPPFLFLTCGSCVCQRRLQSKNDAVTGVSKTKLVPHLCLTCCFCRLVTGGPQENGGDNPAWGTKPAWLGLARGTVSCRREMSLWGRGARPCALLAPAVSPSTPALPGGD